MRLYYSPGASSLAPHIALREANLAFELVRVDLSQHVVVDTGRALAEIHPLAKVPALELADGEILTEGVAVLAYLADQAPADGLAPPRGTRAHYRMLECLAFVASEIHKGFAPLFDPETPAAYKQHLAADTRPIARLAALLEPGPYVLGASFSVADALVFALLRLGVQAGLDFSAWPHVTAYQARIAARPHVRDAMRAEGLLA